MDSKPSAIFSFTLHNKQVVDRCCLRILLIDWFRVNREFQILPYHLPIVPRKYILFVAIKMLALKQVHDRSKNRIHNYW